MRVRRSIPQKPLTEEQKQRALEAQKNVSRIQGPLTMNQMYQTQQSPLSTRGTGYPYNTMNRSFMMDKKATFEEKYGVFNQPQQQQGTNVEFTGELNIPVEDTVVPPSLEEDPNQSSPLPPDVHNASEEDDLDAFIKKAEQENKGFAKQEEIEIPVIQQQPPELGSATLHIYEEGLKQLTIKQLKEEYKDKGGTRNISMNNNKKSLINLILELVINGASQKEEDGAAAGQDGSID